MAFFDKRAPIIDPLVPREAAEWLRYSGNLIPFAEQRPWAEPAGVRALVVPLTGLGALGTAIMALAFVRLTAHDIDGLHLQQVPYFLVIVALLTGLVMLLASVEGFKNWRDTLAQWQSKCQAIRWHRRYVVPDTDLDADAASTWARVARATNTIRRSRAVREHTADPVWVTTVLPHLHWDIAEKLTRLSWLRRRQREILAAEPGIGSDPAISQILAAQRQVQELVAADVEHHVRLLEDVASQAAILDTRVERQQAIRELSALNEQHEELAASIASGGAWYARHLERASRDLAEDIDH
jgi:hypothetical protein